MPAMRWREPAAVRVPPAVSPPAREAPYLSIYLSIYLYVCVCVCIEKYVRIYICRVNPR